MGETRGFGLGIDTVVRGRIVGARVMAGAAGAAVGATGGTAAVPRIVRTVGVGPPAGTAVASVGC